MADPSELTEMYDDAVKLKEETRYNDAIDKLNQLLTKDESHALSHLALADLYGKVGDHESAVKHGLRACELEPNEAFNFTAMSVTYVRAFSATQDHKYVRLAEEAKYTAATLQMRRQP
ncbi:MAG: scaffolding protein [Planctomycetes bacterium]|nr:scaffolding protein [Planctomycetota bacterium]